MGGVCVCVCVPVATVSQVHGFYPFMVFHTVERDRTHVCHRGPAIEL
jgi:hypothetical protein